MPDSTHTPVANATPSTTFSFAVNHDQTQKFLSLVFEPSDWLELRAIGPNRAASCYLKVADLDRETIRQWIDVHHNPRYSGMFFGVAARKTRPTRGPGRAASSDDVLHARTLWADLDPNGESPVDLAEALARIDAAALPKPSIVVHSGGGLHLYWLLAEPLEAARIQPTNRAIAEAIGHGSTFKTDRVADSVRVLRLPGSLNFKRRDEPRPCRVLEANGNRYALDQFPPPIERSESRTRDRGEVGESEAEQVESLLARLHPDRADDRDQWVRVGLICKAIELDSGVSLFDAWDRWSQQSDKYDSTDCARRWRTFQPRGEANFGSLVYMANADSPRGPSADAEAVDQLNADTGPVPCWMPQRARAGAAPERGAVPDRVPPEGDVNNPHCVGQSEPPLPVFRCPALTGVEFAASRAGRSHKRAFVEFEIRRDGHPTGDSFELRDSADSTAKSLTAVGRVVQLTKTDRQALRKWMNTVLRRRVAEIAKEAMQAESEAKLERGSPAVTLLKAFIHRQIGPAYSDRRRGWWLEKGGEFVRLTSVADAVLDRDAIQIVRESSDHAPGPDDDATDSGMRPTTRRLLQIAAAEIGAELPDELNAGLGRDSKAARDARNELRALLTARSTTITEIHEGADGLKSRTYRASFIGRAIRRLQTDDTVDAWSRLVENESVFVRRSDRRIWVAIRRDFLANATGPHLQNAFDSDKAMHTLLGRYGLLETAEAPSDRAFDQTRGGARIRLAVLDRGFLSDLIFAAETEQLALDTDPPLPGTDPPRAGVIDPHDDPTLPQF